MTKRHHISVAIFLTAVLEMVAWQALRTREPIYGGRSLKILAGKQRPLFHPFAGQDRRRCPPSGNQCYSGPAANDASQGLGLEKQVHRPDAQAALRRNLAPFRLRLPVLKTYLRSCLWADPEELINAPR